MSETKIAATWIRRNPWMTALACVPWAGAIAAIIASVVTGVPFAAIAPHLAIIGALVFVATWRRKPRARKIPIEVRVDEHVMHVGDDMVPRGLVKSAELMPTFAGPVVRVSAKKRLADDFRP